MEKNSRITEQPFAKAWGRSSSLILSRSSMWKSVKKSKPRNVSSATYNIYDPLYENRTYEAVSNFEKEQQLRKEQKFISFKYGFSIATVSLKPFASKRCLLVCQQNLVVELYYGFTTDLEIW